MGNIYNEILKSKSNGKKLLAILLDPDKIEWANLDVVMTKINTSPATHIFVGGSVVISERIDDYIRALKENCSIPVILFPGSPSQISTHADGILFLSLISGRNPDFLIGHHVEAAPILINTDLEIIPTGYMVIESGSRTAVLRVSQTDPMPITNTELILNTALAGEMLGNKLIYLEAGSGAENPVPLSIIKIVSRAIKIPLIIGGGIVNRQGIENAWSAGADIVVIGTAFENDSSFFDE